MTTVVDLNYTQSMKLAAESNLKNKSRKMPSVMFEWKIYERERRALATRSRSAFLLNDIIKTSR